MCIQRNAVDLPIHWILLYYNATTTDRIIIGTAVRYIEIISEILLGKLFKKKIIFIRNIQNFETPTFG